MLCDLECGGRILKKKKSFCNYLEKTQSSLCRNVFFLDSRGAHKTMLPYKDIQLQ